MITKDILYQNDDVALVLIVSDTKNPTVSTSKVGDIIAVHFEINTMYLTDFPKWSVHCIAMDKYLIHVVLTRKDLMDK